MSKTKNMDGPWKYDPATGSVFHDDGNIEPLIASVNFEGVSPEQAHADGHLITAAPDLLAELRRDLNFVLEMKAVLKIGGLGDGVQALMAAMREAAIRAALAKAEGGTNE